MAQISQFSSARFPTRDIYDLGLQSGDPVAFASLANSTAQNISNEANQSQKFGLAIMDLLKQYQSLGTRPFQEVAIAGQEEQLKRLSTTPQELIGASPGLQASVRSAAAGAVSPTIQGAQAAGQTFGEQLRGFGSNIEQVRGLLRDFEETERVKKEETRRNLLTQLELGGSSVLEFLAKEQPDALKLIGLDPKSAQVIVPILRAREQQAAVAKQGILDVKGEVIGQPQPLTAAQLNDAISKGYATDQQLELYRSIAAGGETPLNLNKAKTISGDAAKVLAITRSLKDDIKQLQGEFSKDYRTALVGIISGTNRTLDKLAYDVADKVLRLRTGATAPEQEVRRFIKQIFSTKDLLFGNAEGSNANLDRFIKEADIISSAITGEENQQAAPSNKENNQKVTPSRGGDGLDLKNIKLGSPLSRANNNPGNLRFARQLGAAPGKGGFARFTTPKAGTQALANQIYLDARRGHTLASFITKYAPPTENDTATYIRQASTTLGVPAGISLIQVDKKRLIQFMAQKESGSIIG